MCSPAQSLIKFYQYNNPNNVLKNLEIRDTSFIKYNLNKVNGNKLKILVDIIDSTAVSKFEREHEFASRSTEAIKNK